MAYIEGFNCYVSFFEKGTKMKCTKCGLIKGDNKGVNSRSKMLDFGEIKTTVHCTNCDNDTFVVSSYFEPYIEDTIMEIHEENSVNSSVDDVEEEYGDQELDDVPG